MALGQFARRWRWPRVWLCLRWVALALLLVQCTTSRSVWLAREGWRAEARGDRAQALSLYELSAASDSRQVAARLNWIRLRAQTPEGREDAQKALDVLLKEQPSEPRVAAFAATWALWQGDAGLARARLDYSRTVVAGDPPDVAAAQTEARLQLLIARHQWQDAWPLAAAATPAQAHSLRHAVVAARTGHTVEAADWSSQAGRSGTGPASQQLSRASLQLALGQHAEALAMLAALPDDADVLALRARALLALDHTGPALAAAAQAARLAPGDLALTELWAVALLRAQQPAMARDLLVGATARGGGWTVWYHVGLAHLALGDARAAQQAFQNAVAQCGGKCPSADKNARVLSAAGL